MTPTEPTFDDPNREAVGAEPIWTGADDETPEADPEPEPEPESDDDADE